MANVGFATLSIIPSARGFRQRLQREVGDDIDAVGRRLGDRFGDRFSRAASRSVKIDIDPKRGIFSNITRALIALGRNASKVFDRMAGGLGTLGKVGRSVFTSFQGPIANIIKLAGILLAALAAPIGVMLAFQAAGAVAFGALQVGAAGVIGVFAAIGIAAVASSKKVKKEFTQLGKDLKRGLADAAQPMIATLVSIAGRTREVFSELKPELSGIFKDLAPVVETFFNRFADSLTPVINQLRPFVRDLLPSFEALGRGLQPIMAGLAKFMGLIGDAIRDTAPQFEQFLVNLGKLFEPLGRFIAALIRIGSRVLPGLTNKLALFTEGLAFVAESLNEFFRKAKPGELFDALAVSVKNFVVAFVQGLTGGDFQGAKGVMDNLAKGIRDLTAFLQNPETQKAIKDFARAIGDFIRDLPKHIETVKTFLADLKTAWSTIKFIFTNPVKAANLALGILLNKIKINILGALKDLLTNIIDTLEPLPGNMEAPFEAARARVEKSMREINADTRSKLDTLTGDVRSGLKDIPPAFRDSWHNANLQTNRGTSQVQSSTSGGVSRVLGIVGPISGLLPGPFNRGWDRSTSATRRGVGRAGRETGRMPGVARRSLGGIGGVLVGAGVQLMQGMVGGILSMASRVASAAASVVRAAVSAAQSALRIGSPSKVFAEIGRQSGEGFAEGMLASRRRVALAGASMTGSAVGSASQTRTGGRGPVQLTINGVTSPRDTRRAVLNAFHDLDVLHPVGA